MMMRNERRKYPRIDLAGQVNLMVNGVVRTGSLTNLSPCGIQVEARHQLVEQIARHKSEAGLYPEFELEFPLPDASRLQCRCTVSYCRRLSQDNYHLGLDFVALRPEDEQRLDSTLNQLVAA